MANEHDMKVQLEDVMGVAVALGVPRVTQQGVLLCHLSLEQTPHHPMYQQDVI